MSSTYDIEILDPSKVEDKEILLIGPEFFGITRQLCTELSRLGAHADTFDTRPDNTFATKALIRLNPALLHNKISKYYDKLLSRIQGKTYDHILIIKGEGTPERALSALRRQHPEAQLILYNWDEVSQYQRHYEKIRPYFDRILSFDPNDCARYGMEFVPNFYDPALVPSTAAAPDTPYDLMFVGTIHPERLALISKVRGEMARQGLKPYLYLYRQHPLLHLYDQLMTCGKCGNLETQYAPMSRARMYDIYRDSRAVLDINRDGQHGLSQRAIETIGAHRKLITTNTDVVNYDFYHPSNVLIIDRSAPEIDPAFVTSPYVEMEPQIYRRYSIGNWIANVFKQKRGSSDN